MNKHFGVTSGSNLRCRGWRQEGLLRLLENVLAVGEDPGNLVVYAALGKAARDWPSHDKIVETLRTMADDETLIVQSGKPIGLIQVTYEIFMRIAERHFGNSLKGRFILTAGLGGMGGAQPLAGRMAGAVILFVEIDPGRITKSKANGFLDQRADDLDSAIMMVDAARREGRAASIGLAGNAADVYEALLARHII